MRTKLFLTVFLAFLPFNVLAETIDFGGSPEKFKGEGDLEPPRCQFDVPRGATEAFFIRWNCVDNYTPQTDIRTELWLYKNGALTGQKLSDFLGFPASVKITSDLLGTPTVKEGLPAKFRLLARDRAGVSTISPFLTVSAQDNTLSICTLQLVTDEADNNRTVTLTDAIVTTSQIDSTDVKISTVSNPVADPCEINEICDSDKEIRFEAFVDLKSTSEVKSTITVTTGSVTANLTGTATVEDSKLTELELSGDTLIDGIVTNVELSCGD